MPGMLKKFGASFIVLGMCAFGYDAIAVNATGRAAYNVTQLNRAGVTQSAASQRMPTMPTLPGNSVGNLSPNLPSGNSGNGGGGGDGPDNPDNPEPQPEPECPDGGVKNSEYTIENCMNDLLMCINNGALPGGLNDMFDEDVRNSIINGMGLCQIQVEKCITDVRRDCKNVYRSSSDVWIDFNARRVQPEYYNFVLRKTGLTPNQAENTCLLLDRNTYGSSFNAVSGSGGVTAEYNQVVGAYNNQNGNMLIKTKPQGVEVNTNGLTDAARGHYARWDPKTAECWLRVAAYNKDTHIKNTWLFGAAGDDQPAEVWRVAGDTFTCNRDLFGFSLMNQSRTAAVVGVGGGTVLGAGIGAIAGHGARAFDCSRENHREMLTEELRVDASVGTINKYLDNDIDVNVETMTVAQCQEVVKLYDTYETYESAVDRCELMEINPTEEIIVVSTSDAQCVTNLGCVALGGDMFLCAVDVILTGCDNVEIVDEDLPDSEFYNANCSFYSLDRTLKYGGGPYCESTSGECRSLNQIKVELTELDKVFNTAIKDLIKKGEASNMWKSVGIGAGVGAGAGGLATAITAFVERSNINCRVGDDLAQIGYGKSYTIGSLRDFYVKWNLNLPDTIYPTGTAVDCDSWRRACGTLTNLNQCENAKLNYKPADATSTTLINSACVVSGSVCIENYPVARSYGACE